MCTNNSSIFNLFLQILWEQPKKKKNSNGPKSIKDYIVMPSWCFIRIQGHYRNFLIWSEKKPVLWGGASRVGSRGDINLSA